MTRSGISFMKGNDVKLCDITFTMNLTKSESNVTLESVPSLELTDQVVIYRSWIVLRTLYHPRVIYEQLTMYLPIDDHTPYKRIGTTIHWLHKSF